MSAVRGLPQKKKDPSVSSLGGFAIVDSGATNSTKAIDPPEAANVQTMHDDGGTATRPQPAEGAIDMRLSVSPTSHTPPASAGARDPDRVPAKARPESAGRPVGRPRGPQKEKKHYSCLPITHQILDETYRLGRHPGTGKRFQSVSEVIDALVQMPVPFLHHPTSDS
jgi:hypothetical protein